MVTVYGTYRKNIFFNQEKGQSAFLLKPAEGTCQEYLLKNGCIKVVGKFCLQQKCMPLAIDGEWRKAEYGPELHIRNIVETSCTEKETSEFIAELSTVISSLDIRRITKVVGEDIFAAAVSNSIENDICEKTKADFLSVTEIFNKVRALKRELDLFKFLNEYNGTYDHCIKLLKKYPDNALEMVLNKPYVVAAEVNIPFKMLDQIALDRGINILDEERVSAILYWCMKKESGSGNVFISSNQLFKAVSKQFKDIPKEAVENALKNHSSIKNEPDYPDAYYLSDLLLDEKKAAHDFARLLSTKKQLPFHPEFIDQIEEERGFAFGNQQRQAFQLLKTTGVKLLTGDPGTGKTTTVNGLLKYLEMLWDSLYGKLPVFALCAPAGRAAQRMKETTNRNAQTIHKLIEYQPFDGNEYYKDASDPIKADVIVVDEVSMLGLSTFSKLIAAIEDGALVMLVGDTNQLQSVEQGNVLQDIIDSRCVDRCHLSEVFRQAAESLINQNAKKIIRGEEDLATGADFKIIKCTPEETQDVLKATVQDMIEEYGDPNKVQALAPVRKGTCGVKDGNVILQNIFNPGKGGIWYGYRNYKLNDRVMMMSNNYALQYYNGDVGYIKKLSDSSMEISIGSEMISLPREQYGDMDLAYNCTVHKSQGSEYDYLVIVLQEAAAGMLDQNLLYTAVTRGKKEVRIIYENNALQKAIRTARKGGRNSHLVDRIYAELKTFSKIAC